MMKVGWVGMLLLARSANAATVGRHRNSHRAGLEWQSKHARGILEL